MGVIFVRSVSDTIFTTIFLSKPFAGQLANYHAPPVVRGPQFHKHYFTTIVDSLWEY
jgi:hypothetical protein